MTGFPFAADASLALQAGIWLGAGAAIGISYFRMLNWNVRLLALGPSTLAATLLPFIRFALLAGALWAIASHFGGLPLVAATGGIIAAKAAVLRLWAPA